MLVRNEQRQTTVGKVLLRLVHPLAMNGSRTELQALIWTVLVGDERESFLFRRHKGLLYSGIAPYLSRSGCEKSTRLAQNDLETSCSTSETVWSDWASHLCSLPSILGWATNQAATVSTDRSGNRSMAMARSRSHKRVPFR